MPLAASIGEPPPTATRVTRAPGGAAAAAAPAAMSSVVGLGWTPENTPAGMPASSSTPSTAATTGVAARASSVTTSTPAAPVSATRAGSLATLPTPKWAAGLAASTNGSVTDITPPVRSGGDGVMSHRGGYMRHDVTSLRAGAAAGLRAAAGTAAALRAAAGTAHYASSGPRRSGVPVRSSYSLIGSISPP